MSIFSKRIYDIYMRNFQKEALILSVRNTGENNRIVSYLTKDEGILTSVLYGGPKSKLRSLVSTFNYGIFIFTMTKLNIPQKSQTLT